jgi:type II secretory pathway pseudopilin PulG
MENQEPKIEPITPETPVTPEQPAKKAKPKWIVPAIIVVGIIILGATAILMSLNSARSPWERDTSRRADLRQLTLALEMYYDDYGKFPENLEELSPEYMAAVPKDPKSKEAYGYVLIKDNKAILKAILDNKKSQTLKEDVDGNEFGINCDDPAYCLVYEIEELDEFADWKTYRNEKVGFALKYPSQGWIAETSGVGFWIWEESLESIGGIGCSIHTIDGVGFMEETVQGDPIIVQGEERGVGFFELDSGGFYRGITTLPFTEEDDQYMVVVFVKSERKPDNFFDIAEGGIDDYCMDISYKILSTFKFIESFSGWKTYRNEYGFEFKYPKDFSVSPLNDIDNNYLLLSDPNGDWIFQATIHSREEGDETCCADFYLGAKPYSVVALDTEKAYKYYFEQGYESYEYEPEPFEAIAVEHNNMWLAITAESLNQEVIKNVLFSFKFVDPIQESEDEYKHALIQYFKLLNDQKYTEAAEYYGGTLTYLEYWNPGVPRNNKTELFEAGCELNKLSCLEVKKIVGSKSISPRIFEFAVRFSNEDGSIFTENRRDGTIRTDFTYRVKKFTDETGDKFLVITPQSPIFPQNAP